MSRVVSNIAGPAGHHVGEQVAARVGGWKHDLLGRLE
jgi:hypothetical protein